MLVASLRESEVYLLRVRGNSLAFAGFAIFFSREERARNKKCLPIDKTRISLETKTLDFKRKWRGMFLGRETFPVL